MRDAARLELSRRIRCSTEELFEAWCDPDSVRLWMCPDPDVRIIDLDWNPEVGRSYRIEMSVGGERIAFGGRFVEVDAPRKLAFTWTSVRTGETETAVEVDFRSVPDGAEVRLIHTKLPGPAVADEHRIGWENILSRLAAHVGVN